MTEKAISRVGDHGTGTCTGHTPSQSITVTFTSGSPTVDANGQKVMRIGDKGLASCGHTTTATTGSSVVKADGIAVHRVGDVGVSDAGGTYTVTTGSPTVFAN